MGQEIQLISDGDGVAVIGDPTAVDLFLSSANLSSKELPLGKLGSAARSGGAARAGSAALETGAEIAANSGRWLKLTEESANALKLGTAMKGSAEGVSRAIVTDNGKISSILEFAKAPAAMATNPAAATGDGLAAALRAGAKVRDLEFFQFHPTALAGPGFLVSEAVRGAGARIVDEQGRRFLPEIDDRAELAPRNVVALALHRRSVAQNGRPCFLDARLVPEFADRFPSITRGLAAHGLNPACDLIPVTPAAHYFMGGIATDLVGRTSIAGLYAVGEVACTGVHGANRLASNSLLEAVVFAARAARAIEAELVDVADPAATAPICVDRALPRRMSLSRQKDLPRTGLSRSELRDLTWAHLGVERRAAGLRLLLDRLGEDPVPDGRDESLADRVETANLALIAEHMARHALAREHSLGAHTRTDTPDPSAVATGGTTTDLLQEATAC